MAACASAGSREPLPTRDDDDEASDTMPPPTGAFTTVPEETAAAAVILPPDGWFAGFFDAEGCVSLGHMPPRTVHGGAKSAPVATNAGVRLAIEQVDDGSTAQLCQARFGGQVYRYERRNGCVVWRWELSARSKVADAAVVLLRSSRNVWKRVYLALAIGLCTTEHGIARANAAAQFVRLKALEHAGQPAGPEEPGGSELTGAGGTARRRRLREDTDDPELPAAGMPWLAGFLDGDGCVACQRQGHAVVLCVKQDGPHALAVLTPFREAFGGKIYTHARTDPYGDSRGLQTSQWRLFKRADVLRAVQRLVTESRHPDRKAHLELACRMLTVPALERPLGGSEQPSESAREAKKRARQHRLAVWPELRAAKDAILARKGPPPFARGVGVRAVCGSVE